MSKRLLHNGWLSTYLGGQNLKIPDYGTDCSDVGMVLRQTSDFFRPLIRRYNKLKDRQAQSFS
jgi:hypothetical protein